MKPGLPSIDPAVHVFLWGNPGTTARDLGLARGGGFHWVKQRFEWRNIEGKSQGQLRVERARPHRRRHRRRPASRSSPASTISRSGHATSVPWPGTGPPDDPKDWTDYLTALAQRYKGRIQAYEIWNEPNLDREWGDKTPDPAAYTAMLKASYQAIKAADPQALVVSAGMSPTTTNNAQAMPDLEFIRAMYAGRARAIASTSWASTRAGFKADPCADPARSRQSPELTNNDPSPTELKRDLRVPPRRGRARADGPAGRRRTSRWPCSRWAGRPISGPARRTPGSPSIAISRRSNLVGAFQCARQLWQPWMGFMTVIYIPDPAWTQQHEQYWWSITNPDGSSRPAYTALKAFSVPAHDRRPDAAHSRSPGRSGAGRGRARADRQAHCHRSRCPT